MVFDQNPLKLKKRNVSESSKEIITKAKLSVTKNFTFYTSLEK